MNRTWYDRLARLGRWPRRVTALLCLALAAVSALSAQRPTPADATNSRPSRVGIAARLAPGQLAVPVTLSDGSASAYVHNGDRIDLYASADPASGVSQPAVLVATRLLVISVLTPPADSQGTGGTRVIVSAERRVAARIAGTNGQQILAVVDEYP
jgi:hypothetical protein